MLKYIFEMITEPIKALYIVMTGTLTGYVPDAINEISRKDVSNFDIYFQRCIWTFTLIVAVTAIISFIQKQIDRYKRNRKEFDYED